MKHGSRNSRHERVFDKTDLLLLYQQLFKDLIAGRPNSIKRLLEKDIQVLVQRTEHEGLHFLTTVLPTLGKALLSAFRLGIFVCPKGLQRCRGTTLPRFLRGLLEDIFDLHGFLRIDAPAASITEVLQVCFLAYKLETSDALDASDALEGWVNTESELRDLSIDPEDPDIALARTIIGDVLSDFNHLDIKPTNGPGAVSSGEKRGTRQKWRLKRRIPTLDAVYHPLVYWNNRPDYCGDYQDDVIHDFIHAEIIDTPTTKQVAVPKDSRGPRLISTEPLPMMWIQKGVQDAIYRYLETHSRTRGRINFTDQSVNAKLALESSKDDSAETFATLDLKDASDRVSCKLVHALFSSCTKEYNVDGCKPSNFYTALFALRSTHTRLLNGSVVPLEKFSPMGSAICFPVEALTFWALAVAAISNRYHVPWQKICKCVYVYGDDIIVKSKHVDAVYDSFPKVGLKINLEKSFVHGAFRESCGTWAFSGQNITPIKWRVLCTGTSCPAESIVGCCSSASQFYSRGYLQLARTVWNICERLVGKLPITHLTHEVPFLSRKTRLKEEHFPQPLRLDKDTQTVWHKAVTYRRKRRKITPWTEWERVRKLTCSGSAADPEVDTASGVLQRVWAPC